MGVPQARWMVYFMENRDLRWMMTGGTPFYGWFISWKIRIEDG